MDAPIIELRGVGIPFADSLPIILRKQIKLANSGVLGRRKNFGKYLLKDVGNTLHLLTGHVAIAPFKSLLAGKTLPHIGLRLGVPVEAVKLASPELQEVVKDLQALRGIAQISAVTIAAELRNITRFEGARQLMGYSGAVPAEDSSGERRRRGSITKTGNAHARRLLTEAAWNYRFKARIGREALARQEALSEPIRTTAWKAQLRLTQRFAALRERGVQINKACVAVARELAGFIWAIGLQAQQEKAQKT